MDITPLVREGQQVIQGYSEKGFRIAGQLYETAVIVIPEKTMVWDVSKSAEEIKPEDFSAIPFSDIDVVLFGCGSHMVRVDRVIYSAMKEQGVSLEVMDSAAACRTYNVLMAEGRRVAAVLLPV